MILKSTLYLVSNEIKGYMCIRSNGYVNPFEIINHLIVLQHITVNLAQKDMRTKKSRDNWHSQDEYSPNCYCLKQVL